MKFELDALVAFCPALIPRNTVWLVDAVPRSARLVPRNVSVPPVDVEPMSDVPAVASIVTLPVPLSVRIIPVPATRFRSDWEPLTTLLVSSVVVPPAPTFVQESTPDPLLVSTYPALAA